jgi:uncharacterized protein
MKKNLRRCLACRKIAAKEEFWRIVRCYPDRSISLDVGMGRSVYICPNTDCLNRVYKKDRLGRSLKAPVPEKIYQSLWQRL